MDTLIHRNLIKLSITFAIILTCCLAFSQTVVANPALAPNERLEVNFIKTTKGAYYQNQQVKLATFSLTNQSDAPAELTTVSAEVRDFVTNEVLRSTTISDITTKILPADRYQIPSKTIYFTGTKTPKKSYAIYLKLLFADGTISESYQTFFRVVDAKTLTSYRIETDKFRGLPVYRLRGGLSAEYSVQKSAASFNSGISHSWTYPIEIVESTPDFLERSIDNTIKFYNTNIGVTTAIDTVIISTGVPGVPYLARNTNALVLPLHFLVGSGTVKEAQTILNHANHSGYSTYGTIGHDYSISTSQSVGWIKLLDLPEQYVKFIKDHKVKNVILCGQTGNSDGEIAAQKVQDSRNEYAEGSLYLMRFSGDASDGYLKNILSDYDQTMLSEVANVADWEAGIIPDQIKNFTKSLKNLTEVTISSVTARNGVYLWNIGTYTSLALAKKNQDIYEQGGPAIRGITTNQYLVGNPAYESYMRYIPFLYYAAFTPEYQYDNWLNKDVRAAVKSYFPEIVFDDLEFWANRAPMEKYLKDKGHIVKFNINIGKQVWDIRDGINSTTEYRAVELLENITPAEFKKWNKSLQYLDIKDLKDIAKRFPEIKVESL